LQTLYGKEYHDVIDLLNVVWQKEQRLCTYFHYDSCEGSAKFDFFIVVEELKTAFALVKTVVDVC
jgi:hypothetical protein